jgi:hypothetical protein
MGFTSSKTIFNLKQQSRLSVRFVMARTEKRELSHAVADFGHHLGIGGSSEKPIVSGEGFP